ncbi:nitrate- and nitrite sensing domain-containing protein [Streptomonospora sediminis]
MPAAAFIALWLAVSGYLTVQATQMGMYGHAIHRLSTPAATALVTLVDERSQSVAYLERPDETRAQLQKARADSDERTQVVFDRYEPFRDQAPDPIRERMAEFEGRYRGLGSIRDEINAGTATREQVLREYNRLLSTAADLFAEQARGTPASGAVGPSMSAADTFRTVDLLAQSDAQLTRGFANGRLTPADQREFTRLNSAYHASLKSARGFLSPEQTRALERLMGGADYRRLLELENRIVQREVTTTVDPVTGEETRDAPVPVTRQEWDAAYTPVKEELTDIVAAESHHAAGIQTDAALRWLAIAIGGSIGVAVLGFLAISRSLQTTNRVVDRLARLRDETDHRANELLPAVAERLQSNRPLDSAADIPPLTAGDDEIGEVAAAFDKAQRFAVDAAVRQAELAHGVNRVFLNIAHRSQTLIHRQLRLLDRMERDQEDPAQLTELFKLDHLATRSRRNAENLLILGGETPGRTFHRPMPLVDVLRGAISESGDYTRVERHHIARVALKGPAVADVIHLVAELVDNATTFSPPQTRVRLSGERVPNGVAVEIEDRGLGMEEDEFTAANDVLADPPEFDVMRLNEKMHLGLFVVSRLARRHDIGVRLRSSPYGGVQAIVLLPEDLISDQPLPETAFDSTNGQRPQIVAPAPGRSTAPAAPANAAGTGTAATTANGAGPGAAESATPQAPGVVSGDMLADGAPAAEPAADRPGPAEPRYTAAGLPRRGTPRGPHSSPGDSTAPEETDSATSTEETADSRPPAADPSPHSPETAPGQSTEARPQLPKRQPQANLAPQLYETPSGPDGAAAPPASPEHEEERLARLRHNMSAFQQGTRRGRSEGQQRQTDTDKDS